MRLTLCFLLLVAADPAAARDWRRIESPHFTIFTDAGDRTAALAAERLEQVRQAFLTLKGGKSVSPVPVRVFLFDRERDFDRYRRAESDGGLFQGGPDANYILVPASGGELSRVLSHEYTHLVLNHTSPRLPRWLEEGMAEFYSTIAFSGEEMRIGLPPANRLQTLARLPWMDAAELIATDTGSLGDREKKAMFYAESWALVHMLHSAPEYRGAMPRFEELLAGGTPPSDAFRAAFSKNFDQAVEELGPYVQRGLWRDERVKWIPPETTAQEVHLLGEAEAHGALLELQMALGLWETSEQELVRMAAGKRETAQTETSRALVALSRRETDSARHHFEAAIRLGSRQASTYFEYAMLLRELGDDPAGVQANLRRAVELNPNHAEAHFLLGLIASENGQTQEAITSLQSAVAVLPRQTNFWHALALAYRKAGEQEQARHAALRAREAARTPQEREMAEDALRLVDSEGPAAPAPRPEVTTPESWLNRQGDQRVEGTLTRIDCLDESARLHVRTATSEVTLEVKNPNQVVLRNTTGVSFEFACGAQQPRAVAVEHTAGGEVTAIEFR